MVPDTRLDFIYLKAATPGLLDAHTYVYCLNI